MSAEMRTWVKYAAAALTSFLAGAILELIPVLLDPTEPPIKWRMVVGNGLSVFAATWLSTYITRPGKESVAAQVDRLGRAGVTPKQMVVVPSATANISLSTATEYNPRICEVEHLNERITTAPSGRRDVS